MESKYQLSLNALEVMKEKYNSIAVPRKAGTSLESFRKLLADLTDHLEGEARSIEDICAKNKETYSVKLAGQMNSELRNNFKTGVAATQEKMRDILSSLISQKQEAINDFIVASPTDEQLRLLQAVQIRGLSSLSDNEVTQIAGKLVGNYQAIQTFKGMCEAADRASLITPFTEEDRAKELEIYQRNAVLAIGHLGSLETNGNAANFLTAEYFRELSEKLDGDAASTVRDSRSIVDRLTEAGNKAFDAENYNLASRISIFVGIWKNDLISDSDRKEELIARAEGMIAEANGKR